MEVLYLNKQSTALMIQVMDTLHSENETHAKFDANGPDSGIMPLVVEIMATGIIHPSWPSYPAKIVSFAHYYIQEGDLMADPLMEFIYVDGRAVLDSMPEEKKNKDNILMCVKIQPRLFQQDGIFATNQQSAFIEDGRVTKYRHKLMKDHIYFAQHWFKNIKYQQFSKQAKKQKT